MCLAVSRWTTTRVPTREAETYLFAIDGFLFQSPVNYYALRSTWDMSPGYERVTTLPLNHPVDATCLFCHASAVQPVSAGTANRFVGAPFLQSGVGCERCHGAGGSHIRDPRPETIINPARLSPEARDSVCMQCHLEGLRASPAPVIEWTIFVRASGLATS